MEQRLRAAPQLAENELSEREREQHAEHGNEPLPAIRDDHVIDEYLADRRRRQRQELCQHACEQHEEQSSFRAQERLPIALVRERCRRAAREALARRELERDARKQPIDLLERY